MECEVTGCDDCALCSEGCYCGHPDAPNASVWEAAPDGRHGRDYANEAGDWVPRLEMPDWCPLRTDALTLRLTDGSSREHHMT